MFNYDRVIVFSLYGEGLAYAAGMLYNILIARKFWPEWGIVLYIAPDIRQSTRELLPLFDNVQIREMPPVQGISGMVWRFQPCFDQEFPITICRDADSWISVREKRKVDDWIQSSCDFHVIRDCPLVPYPVLGGLWGCKNGVLKEVPKMEPNDAKKYGEDQFFMCRDVYPKVKTTTYAHDPYHEYPDALVDRRCDLMSGSTCIGYGYKGYFWEEPMYEEMCMDIKKKYCEGEL